MKMYRLCTSPSILRRFRGRKPASQGMGRSYSRQLLQWSTKFSRAQILFAATRINLLLRFTTALPGHAPKTIKQRCFKVGWGGGEGNLLKVW
jgi:hypothetical protein